MQDLFAQATPVVHHAAPIVHTVVHNVPVIKTVLVGVHYTTAIIAAGISLLAGFGLGWYVKGRGMTGVKTDLSNAKTVVTDDVAKLEAKFTSTPVVLSAPVQAA